MISFIPMPRKLIVSERPLRDGRDDEADDDSDGEGGGGDGGQGRGGWHLGAAGST